MNIYHTVPGEPLPLGRRWEHNATRIVFDISAWVSAFGAGTVRLLHQRQGDTAPYPVAIQRTDADGTPDNETGTLVLWDVTRTDTAQRQQFGKAELRYYSGTEGAEEFLAKSETYKTVVLDALGASAADAPDEERHWLDTLLEAADSMEENVAAAQSAVSAAQEAAQAAIAASATARNSAHAAAIAAATIPADAAFTDTTYTLTQDTSDGHTLTFAGSDGSSVSVTIPETKPASDLPFTNASSTSMTASGDSIVARNIISASYEADAGTVIGVRATVAMSVDYLAVGDAESGWTALSCATVTARYICDGVTQSAAPSQTLDGGRHILPLQYYFTVADGGTHTIALQLQVRNGAVSIAAGGVVMSVSGVSAAN